MPRDFGPCLCGDTACPSCGAAQGTWPCRVHSWAYDDEPPTPDTACDYCGITYADEQVEREVRETEARVERERARWAEGRR